MYRETVLPPVESKFKDEGPVAMGLIQVHVMSVNVDPFESEPFVMLQVKLYAKDGRLMYDVGPDKVFIKGKYKLELP